MSCRILKATWKVIKESLEATSLKGVPRIFKAKHSPLKVLWLVSVLGFLCFVILQVRNSVLSYLEFKTVINNEELIPSGDLENEFPSVTLCNMKVIHHDRDTSDFASVVEYMAEMDRNISEWADSQTQVDTKNTLEQLRSVPGYYGFIGRKNAIVAGALFSEFVKQCFIDTDTADYSINCSDIGTFSLQSTPESFNCFSYDINHDISVDYQPYKITFMLFLDAFDDFVSTVYESKSRDVENTGVKMALHSKEEPFDFKRKALLLNPGHINAVNIDLAERHRLEEPYGVCTPNTPDAYYVQDGSKVPYSRKACHAACVQANITKACGCREPSMPATLTLEELQLPFCASPRETFSERIQTAQCAMQTNAHVSSSCQKVCTEACSKLDVTPTLTSALWPRPSQQLGLYTTFIREEPYADKFTAYEDILLDFEKTQNQTKTLDELEKLSSLPKNFVLVEVIRRQVGINRIADQIKTTPSDLVSTVGSLLNLYSGITVIIAVEILDLIYNLVAKLLCYKRESQNTKEESRRGSLAMESVNGSMSVRI